MKIKVLEYKRYKGSDIKVKSHKKGKDGIWRENQNFKFHKTMADVSYSIPLDYKREYVEEKE